jgi:hypothetical protein
MKDDLHIYDAATAALIAASAVRDAVQIKGVFRAQHIRDGRVIWEESFNNTVVTVGKNSMLDNFLAGSAYTVTGPFMGLISGTPTTAAADTMSSHAGWTEVGGTNAPAYSGNRPTAAWSAASAGAKALSSALNFTFTSGGTVGGAFLVLGSGAVNTKDNTSGTLFSAGAFGTGNRAVLTSDQLNVSYSVSV